MTAEAEEEEEVVISPSARAEKQKGTEAKGGRGGGKEGINGQGRGQEKAGYDCCHISEGKAKKHRQKKVLYLGRAQRWGIRMTVQTQQVPDGKVCNGDGRGSASTGTGTGLAPELYGAQGALLRACSGTQRGIQRQAGVVSVMCACAGR